MLWNIEFVAVLLCYCPKYFMVFKDKRICAITEERALTRVSQTV